MHLASQPNYCGFKIQLSFQNLSLLLNVVKDKSVFRYFLRHSLILIFAFVANSALAATKRDYIIELESYFQNSADVRRAEIVVRNILENDDPSGLSRFEVMSIQATVMLGEVKRDNSVLNRGKAILIACNHVALDGLDKPDNSILDQISFSLPELIYAFDRLKALHLLDDHDLARSEAMLRKSADYRMSNLDDPIAGNLDLRYAEGILLVANMFPDADQASAWRAKAKQAFDALLFYPTTVEQKPERKLKRSSDGWSFTHLPLPVSVRQVPGGGENSSYYVSATVLAWIKLGKALGIEKELERPEVGAWLDGFYQQIMPNGILPNYGDSYWGPTPEWIAVFEWMGHTFKRPQYRWAAQAALSYAKLQKFPLDVSLAIPFVDDTVPVQMSPQQSLLLKRQSNYGKQIADKIIMRGVEPSEETPYVMMHAVHTLGHSHAFGGSIGAYTLGPSIILHGPGYDGFSSIYHNMFIMRPTSADFFGFYGENNRTLLNKIPDIKAGLRIVSPDRITTEAILRKFPQIDYGRVTFDCLTGGEADSSFNRRAYVHTRESVLDKVTGALVILDTLTARSDGSIQAGPVWHVQSILAKNQQGFLFQNDTVYKDRDVTFKTPPHPIWLAMAGSVPLDINNKTWHFELRHGGDNPQDQHLYARFFGAMKVGESISILSAFVPQPIGSTKVPTDVQLTVKAGIATAKIGQWTYVFQPGARGSTIRFNARNDQTNYYIVGSDSSTN
ncbi:MAG: hypothetical protein EBU00_09450 [Alphaproteobacteria bacterium]|nr:hypothetical protein [Alphaproteobacteria bacterium]